MNIKTYLLDDLSQDIFITVTVSTPGIARSTVELTLPNGTTSAKAESQDGTGLIARTKLGKAADIKDSLVEIDTDILLNLVPKEDWDNCFDNLVIKYYLDGGAAGQNMPFFVEDADKHKSVSGKTIGVEKYIELTKS